MSIRLIVLVVGAAAVLWSMVRWRQAVQIGMVLVVLEGAIRKWLVPGAQDLAYFAKDVFFLGAYLGYLRSPARLRFPPARLPALYVTLGASAILGLLEIFNPELPNVLVGILGVKSYFFYVPLLFVLPATFRSDVELGRFLRRYALLSIPVGLLALAQFFSPSSSALNTYARASDEGYVTTFGSSNFVRVTGTFSYISGYASYLFATAILILAILGTIGWRFKRNLWIYLALGMTLLGMLMTGSRGPVFTLILLFPLYWWLTVVRERQGGATLPRLVLALGLLAVFLSYAGPQAIGAFEGRAMGGEDTLSRFTAPFTSPYEVLPDVGLFGYGIGSTHQTATAVTKGIVPYSWLRGLEVEVESGRVMIELGPVGFVLVYFARIYLIFFAFRQVLALSTTFHRAVATAAFLFVLAELPGGVVFDLTTDVYYWFFTALLLTVMRLDRQFQPPAKGVPAAIRPVPLALATNRTLPPVPSPAR
ncbi:MAG TPA: hypothetical protein VOA87_20245 [Thermoanaerobaculia bacterium]|nr:hypothetical protein [Thermoanaerobaculia bacterium]